MINVFRLIVFWLLYIQVGGDDDDSFEVKVGVVMVKGGILPFKYEMVGPALDMAMEKSEQEFGIVFNVTKNLHGDDCDQVATVGVVSEMHYKVSVHCPY